VDDRYLEQTPNAAIDAWVATGASDALDYSKLKFPDLYGENDLPQVLAGAGQRAKGLPGKSGQVVVPQGGPFLRRPRQRVAGLRARLPRQVLVAGKPAQTMSR